MSCRTLNLSFASFGQLPNILKKKAIYEKSKFAYFVRKQRETNFFSTQARSEILFELETTCHVEL